MQRRIFSLSALSAAVLLVTGCGGGDGPALASEDPAPAPAPAPVPDAETPVLASATALPAATVFLQTVAAADGDDERAPGQANYWDLNQDFALADGGDDQWDDALELSISNGVTVESFPADQTYAELTAYGPELGTAEGLRLVTFAAGRATLHPVKSARLQQTLDLTAAVAPIALTWTDSGSSTTENFDDEPTYYQVVVRDPVSAAVLATVFREGQGGPIGTRGAGSLDAFAGQRVVISFELSNVTDPVEITNVSVIAGVTEFVSNGGFATAAGWNVPADKVSQNVQSGVRTVQGLEVRRMFFTRPDVSWGRFTDTFRNTSGAPVSVTVIYASNLGSDDSGIIYETPGSAGRALTCWDGDQSDRDVAIVHGNAASVDFTSDTGIGNGDGSDDIEHRFAITVPAGGTVTLVNFILMNGTDTGQTAANTGARATAIDAVAADIALNFRTQVAYQMGMTQAQLDTLQNF